MTRLFVSVALALLVVLAGCGAGTTTPTSSPTTAPNSETVTATDSGSASSTDDDSGDSSTDSTTEQSGGSPTESATPSPTDTPTPSPTATPDPDTQNPWNKEVVSVALETNESVESRQRHVTALRDAVTWVNSNVGKWGEYPLTLRYESSPKRADVVVTATPAVTECGDEEATTTFGFCGPVFDSGDTADSQEEIEVASRFNDSLTQTYYRGALAQLTGVEDVDEATSLEYPEDRTYLDPWPESDPVVVGIAGETDNRDWTPLVEQAVQYWESGAGAPYRNYTADFVVRPNAEDPDVVVKFTDAILECGTELDAYTTGCAPILGAQSLAEETETIEVETGYTNASTLSTLKHEFGHLHGRLHEQQPMPLMNASSEKNKLPTPNATERTNAWEFTTINVYIETENVSSLFTEDFQQEVLSGLEWMENGADGAVEADLRYDIVQSRSEADLVITKSESDLGEYTSNSRWYGSDVDVDEALETVNYQRITIASDIDTRTVAYYVAYWSLSVFTGGGENNPDNIDGEDDDRERFPR